MFRPTGFNDLAGKRVGIFGYGIEGRAAAARLAQHAELVIVDDSADLGPEVLQTSQGGIEALAKCDVVIKSPGISPYRPEVAELAKAVTVTSALNLWMHEIDRDRVIGVTGTKGKSTTTALITFFLNALGEKAQALGNIGLPPYDPSVDTSEGWLVLEISSYQARDLQVAPAILALTSLGSDHLDWHGSVENYHRDKLSISRLNPAPKIFFASIEPSNFSPGAELVELEQSGLTEALRLLGQHNHSNVAVALSVVSHATGLQRSEILGKLKEVANDFTPLPGRLTEVAREVRDGREIRYIDDGLATAALPTIAALSVFPSGDVALIAGGFDRGVDYVPLVESISQRKARTVVVTIGEAGSRIGAELHKVNPEIQQIHAANFRSAVELARSALGGGGTVLFSPAAPSFDEFKNWSERSSLFANTAKALTVSK
jgi:UDP-N-acetylmuramoyl-L-alanine---L-glutamate ligase